MKSRDTRRPCYRCAWRAAFTHDVRRALIDQGHGHGTPCPYHTRVFGNLPHDERTPISAKIPCHDPCRPRRGTACRAL
ncbi:hypothetical protein HMPREF1147_0826 [Selenomonas sp. FOBRC9]|nr:hypothetical protein HMPREF1147_0826 [Selenomonas sp. FOBRC9]